MVVAPERVVRERVPGDPVDRSIIIYDFEGELFFGAAPELERYLEELGERIKEEDIMFLVLRVKRVRHPDAVVIERIGARAGGYPTAASPSCSRVCKPTCGRC